MAALAVAAAVLAGTGGCATRAAARGGGDARGSETEIVPIERAEAALAAKDGPRAIALFRRYLASKELDAAARARAYPGLARAYELVGDFDAAVRAYEAALEAGGDSSELWARRGAAEAELLRWEASEESFRRAFEASGEQTLPSTRIELLARRALALFSMEDYTRCEGVLEEAEAIYMRALETDAERFSTFYFVGMVRFYRAAVLHARFRALPVRLPETQMAKDFDAKLELLVQAQEAYNATIETKHVYWVSAAGYQLGHLFEEFYDALMHAPVPAWLDERQKRTYYEELKEQLRPVVNKAIWVFERNLEAARRLGYETEFTQQSEAALARLQSILLSGDTALGQPHPQLAPSEGVGDDEPAVEAASAPALERKLFIPQATPL